MADFTIRSDHVDVEQIMRQIRMRIKEKRGVDYTEEEVRELANVKLEKFLNPRAIRSELVEHYRRQRPPVPLPALPPPPDNYGFEADTIYESHREPLQWVRRLLNPILKLFFNPNPIIHVLHRQGHINAHVLQQFGKQFDHISQRFVTRDELDALNFEVLNNIVLELTRLGVEVKNLTMRIESMNARQDFNERRARAFEELVTPPPGPGVKPAPREGGAEGEDAEARTRRRRRRRGRRRPEEGAETAAGRGEPRPPDAPARTSAVAEGDEPTLPTPSPPSEPGPEQ
jgi:hypothetical protein